MNLIVHFILLLFMFGIWWKMKMATNKPNYSYKFNEQNKKQKHEKNGFQINNKKENENLCVPLMKMNGQVKLTGPDNKNSLCRAKENSFHFHEMQSSCRRRYPWFSLFSAIRYCFSINNNNKKQSTQHHVMLVSIEKIDFHLLITYMNFLWFLICFLCGTKTRQQQQQQNFGPTKYNSMNKLKNFLLFIGWIMNQKMDHCVPMYMVMTM